MPETLGADALIRAVERPDSESARVWDHVLAGELEATVDEPTLREVERFFSDHRGRSFAWMYTSQVRRNARVVASGADFAADARAAARGVAGVYNRRDFARSLLISAVVGTALVLINVRPGQVTGNPADGPD